jgi:uncharacterized protein (TIGR02594 family)
MATEFTVKNLVHLREIPNGAVPSPRGTVDNGDVVTILSKQGEWSEVRAVDKAGNVRTGFVPTSMIEELPSPALRDEAIDETNFARVATLAAVRSGVNRDYLVAVAWVESRIKNVLDQTTGARGPFQFTPSTWAGLVAQHGQQEEITERDIDNWGKQPAFAAIRTAEAQDQLVDKLGRLPTGAELYVSHRLGLPAALEVLATDQTTPIDRALLAVFQGQADAEGAVRGLVENNKALFKAGDSVKTIEAVLVTAAERLDEGLHAAARIVAVLPEDEQFAPRLAGEEAAPWMIAAQQELRSGVIEDKRPGHSHPRINAYHATTTLGEKPDDVAWCAAFVSFCMQNAKNEFVVSQNLKSARAADWLTWGKPITEPTWGAVCVLEPLAPKSSGHVGFVTGSDATHVTLLGGNQRDTDGNESVNEQRFSKLKVRGYRWLDRPRSDSIGDSTTSADSSVAQGTRVKQAYDHLKGHFTHEQAAGLVGNFMQESSESLDPTALNVREGAIGIAQWRLDRRENLKAFAVQRHTTETNFQVQLEFVMHELNGKEARARAKIMECTTTEAAAIAVREHYERAQRAHDSQRIAFAQKVAARFQTT